MRPFLAALAPALVLVLASIPLAAAQLPGGCIDASAAFVCPFVGADTYMTGGGADAYLADGTSVGIHAYRVEGFLGPAIIADAHGSYGGTGWHAGAGSSDYNYDNVPDSTCVCVGVWDAQHGYLLAIGAGTFDLTGDGPSADDTFASAGVRHDGALRGLAYGWENGAPYVIVVLP